MSFTAFPVLASLLASSKLLGTPLGTQAMSCAAIDDILAWCTLALASSFAKSGELIYGLYTCLAALVYVIVMSTVVRLLLKWFHQKMEARKLTDNRWVVQ
jgi:Kef-type K+ transport system membrane component KefB